MCCDAAVRSRRTFCSGCVSNAAAPPPAWCAKRTTSHQARVGHPGHHGTNPRVVGRGDLLSALALRHRAVEHLHRVGAGCFVATGRLAEGVLERAARRDRRGRAKAHARRGGAAQLQRPLCRAERDAGVSGAEEGDRGQLKPRPAPLDVATTERQREGLRHEHVVDLVVVAARTLQPHHVPRIFDRHAADRDDRAHNARDRTLRIGRRRSVLHDRVRQHPLAVADAAGERPAPVQRVAVVVEPRPALRIGGAGDPREAVAEHRIQPGAVGDVRADHAGGFRLDHRHPAARHISHGQPLEDLDLGGGVNVVAAHLERRGHREDVGRLERPDRGLAERAELGRFVGVLAQDIVERFGALQPGAALRLALGGGSTHGAPPLLGSSMATHSLSHQMDQSPGRTGRPSAWRPTRWNEPSATITCWETV